MASYVAAQSAYSRVFITEGGSSPANEPEFQSCVIAGAVEQSFGDATNIECPDPTEYGKFVVVGTIRGAAERPTITLRGRYARNVRSELLRLALQRSSVDIHVHFGSSSSPNVFEDFDKAVVIRDAVLTSWSTDDLGALSAEDTEAINEELEVSGTEMFEIVQLDFTERAVSAITNELVGAVMYNAKKGYTVSIAAGGSPSTPADVLYTEDGGSNWTAVDIDTLNAANSPTGIAVLGTRVVVISNAADAHYHADGDDMVDGATAISWAEVTGYNAAGSPNAIDSVGAKAFVVGDGGYVYELSSAASTPVVIDAGVATSENLLCVSMAGANVALAGGESGALIYTTDGITWSAAPTVPTIFNINAVAAFNDEKWMIGTDDGRVFYTLNGGASWVEKSFTNSGTGSVTAMYAPNETVVYLAHQNASTQAVLHRSYDGGYSWSVMPEGTGTLPAADKINALAGFPTDVNLIVGAGLADDGSDGYLVVGKP